MFLHPNLDHTDPTARVAAIEASLATARAHEHALSTVHALLAAELDAVRQQLAQERGDRRALDERRADLEQALRQLERGVSERDGTLPQVTPFLNTAGLVATRDAIATLTAELAEWLPLRDRGDTRATYRLKENVGAHHGPSGTVFPGETIELTLRQYRAWQDKFELVTEGAPASGAAAVPTT